MATKAIETAGSLDQATLDALREGIAAVLAEQSGSTAVHAFIDGKNSLDRELWSQAASLGWLGFGIPEQYGGLGLGPTASPSCTPSLDGRPRLARTSPRSRRHRRLSKAARSGSECVAAAHRIR